MSEESLQRRVLRLARELGWKAYHTYDSRRSQPGWPDLALVSAKRRRFLVAELKKERGVVSAEQHAWLTALAAAGVETHVWRPTDLLDETVLRVLTRVQGPGDRA
ncbi:VRR-NUC domain-containing protein [Isoptericola sp. QY 916]|nr:VRR-NUC domain-containing protein [Isoptericola sp. QY 916]